MNLPILLVDDDRDTCDVMVKLLSAWGCHTDVAYDGQAALQLVEQKQFGVAIIDYLLPGMNGVELFRRMRQLQPDIAGVFLTGFTTIDVVYPAIEAGILHVMSKPADFKELLPILKGHLATVS
jgi:CheY-like chemotaxis protein